MYEIVLIPLYMKNQQVKIMPSPIKNPWNALRSINNVSKLKLCHLLCKTQTMYNVVPSVLSSPLPD